MSHIPQMHVRLSKHPDGTKYVSLQRGHWSWMKLRIDELPEIANAMIDIYEEEET